MALVIRRGTQLPKGSGSVQLACVICGDIFFCKPSAILKRKCCTRACAALYKRHSYAGEGNPNFGNKGVKCPSWKGGRRLSNYGYVLLHMPEHPNARPDGYILEHRYVMSEYLCRPLDRSEHVHHKDGVKTNNDIDNLELINLGEHTRMHNLERAPTRGANGRFIETWREVIAN
jgi:hypothetical protein